MAACELQDWFIATYSFPSTGRWTIPSLLRCTGTFLSRLRCTQENLWDYTLSLLKQYLHNIKQITSGCQHVPASKHASRRGRWPRIHQRRHRQDCWAEWGTWLLVGIVLFPVNIPQWTGISTATSRSCSDIHRVQKPWEDEDAFWFCTNTCGAM